MRISDWSSDVCSSDLLRQILHARLNVDLPGHRSRLEPAGVRGEANRTLRFFDFVKAKLGRFDLARVDQALVDRYAGALRLAGLRPVAAAELPRIVFTLQAVQHHHNGNASWRGEGGRKE